MRVIYLKDALVNSFMVLLFLKLSRKTKVVKDSQVSQTVTHAYLHINTNVHTLTNVCMHAYFLASMQADIHLP